MNKLELTDYELLYLYEVLLQNDGYDSQRVVDSLEKKGVPLSTEPFSTTRKVEDVINSWKAK